MPNTFAYIMLLTYPLLVAIMFRRMPVERAFIWTILGGYLILPPVAALDLPVGPSLDKHAIPTLCAFVALWMHQGKIPKLMPQSWVLRALIAVYAASTVATVLTNGDEQIVGIVRLMPMSPIEALTGLLFQFVTILPMLMAQNVLKRPQHMREVFIALMIGGLLYSIPMLLEVRLAPQLNVWIYGFFQHTFDQMMRYGGFRPIVFLQHGLWVAFFAFLAVCCSLSLLRHEPERNRPRYFAIAFYLAVVLVLCKTASALIYLILTAPLLLFIGKRIQIRIAAALALVVVLYPMLRGAGLIPVDAILNQAMAMDAERSQSLAFRLINEDMLLARAAERPAFGWGGWSRNNVFDPVLGRSATVVDGLWIGVIGSQGWAGYISFFGLLTVPIFQLLQRTRELGKTIDPYVASLALLLAVCLVDLIPNATLIPFNWLMAGALLGYINARDFVAAESAPILSGARPAPWARQHSKSA